MRNSFILSLGLAALGVFAGLMAPGPVQGVSHLEIPASDVGLPGAGPLRRYDWFKDLWKSRRAAWAHQAERDRGAVVFLGDSITQGWGDQMGGIFPGMKVANRGISGDTTRGVLLRLQDDVLSLAPRAIVLLIGTNDLEEKATPETIVGNVQLILQAITQHNPSLPVLVCQVFPSSAEKSRPADQIKKLNQLYAAAIKGQARFQMVETWPLFANGQGDAKVEEFPDLLHPNAAGYRKWGQALIPLLSTLGLLETTVDSFVPEPGYESLFNGKDLTGWGYRTTSAGDRKAREGWQKSDPNAPPWPLVDNPVAFTGMQASADGRFQAIGGRLVVTAPAEGRRIQQLYTTRDFSKNFILKLEFRASANADSGVFLRGNQLQCRDYPLAGPYKQLKQFRALDWNEMVVAVTNGVAYATCNGEVLEAAMKLPPTGPIGVEGDKGQLEYRRIQIRELDNP